MQSKKELTECYFLVSQIFYTAYIQYVYISHLSLVNQNSCREHYKVAKILVNPTQAATTVCPMPQNKAYNCGS